MDLTVILEDYKLNIRAAAIIIHDNKLLVHKNVDEDFYGLVGGRVKVGENSAKTIKREIFEEMGKKIEIKGYLTTIENFFKGEDMNYHEIMFVYKAEFLDDEDKKNTETIKNIEGEEKLRYEWIDINDLDDIPLKPDAIKGMLKKEIFPSHKINDDLLKEYYDNTENEEPNIKLIQLIETNPKPGNATDIGCGAGRDTIFLLNNGWNVIAIDRRNIKDRILEKLNEEKLKRFEFQKQEFEKIKLEKNDLVVANFSLSFCNKEKFDEMWNKIINSILPDGYFVGNFFGIRDEWKNVKQLCSFFTKEEVLQLFEGFEIIYFEEIEKDGKTGEGEFKHWHYFDVVARKK